MNNPRKTEALVETELCLCSKEKGESSTALAELSQDQEGRGQGVVADFQLRVWWEEPQPAGSSEEPLPCPVCRWKHNPEYHNSPGGMCSSWDLIGDTDGDCKGFKVLECLCWATVFFLGQLTARRRGKEHLERERAIHLPERAINSRGAEPPVLEILQKSWTKIYLKLFSPVGSCLAKGEEQGIS